MTTQPVDESARKSIEVRARTVDEAVARGLVRLGGLSRTEVNIEVLSPGKAGLLGFGAEEALVRLTPLAPGERAEPAAAPAPPKPRPERSAPPAPTATPAPADRRRSAPPRAPAPESTPGPQAEPAPSAAPPRAREEAREAAPGRSPAAPTPSDSRGTEMPAAAPRELSTEAPETLAESITLTLLRQLGFEDAALQRLDTLLPPEIATDDKSLIFSIHGAGTEVLLADEAKPLDALQFLVRLLVNRKTDRWVSVLLDVDGDRARRMRELYQLAEQSASLVLREGKPVSLPPMSAYERRVVHMALHDHPVIATQSIGLGEHRKVTVRRKDQLLPEL